MTKELMDDDIRYLRKWLNEENTSPIDRVALATVLNEVINLRDRMGGSEGLHRINAHKIKFLKDQLAAAQAQRDELLAVVKDFDSLIQYQYTGSQEAMSALQIAAWAAHEVLKAMEDK